MDTNLAGAIAEHRAMLDFIKNGYSVFISTDGKSSIDFIAVKDNETIRIQVKSTSSISVYGRYQAQLKSVRPNRSENSIRKFDGLASDILAIYCVQHDMVQYFLSKDLDGRTQLNINPEDFEENTLTSLLRD